MFGGVGNQLFHIARAIEHQRSGRQVTLVNCANYVPMTSYMLGWTPQKDWLGIQKLCSALKIPVRSATLVDVVILAIHKLLKKLISVFDKPLIAITPVTRYDVGYFQSPNKAGFLAVRNVASELALKMHIVRHRGAAIHFRASDFGPESRIPVDAFESFAEGEDVFVVSDVNASYLEGGRYRHFDGGGPLEDFAFLAGSEQLMISRSTFGLWAGLVAKETGPNKVTVYNFPVWEEYLRCCYPENQLPPNHKTL
jgi:hypothetical protein